jgi:hypothetical protein
MRKRDEAQYERCCVLEWELHTEHDSFLVHMNLRDGIVETDEDPFMVESISRPSQPQLLLEIEDYILSKRKFRSRNFNFNSMNAQKGTDSYAGTLTTIKGGPSSLHTMRTSSLDARNTNDFA